MTKKAKISTAILLIITAVALFFILNLNSRNHYKAEIRKRYTYQKVSSIKTYRKDCALEFKQGIQFPLDKPVSAKLHFDQWIKPPKTLDANQAAIVLGILNDTASYKWGEIGTPHFDRHFSFHDKDGHCIGYTDFSFEGQTYATPHLAKMKWGMLTEHARAILIKTIDADADRR